jgi:hypothetical protein
MEVKKNDLCVLLKKPLHTYVYILVSHIVSAEWFFKEKRFCAKKINSVLYFKQCISLEKTLRKQKCPPQFTDVSLIPANQILRSWRCSKIVFVLACGMEQKYKLDFGSNITMF